MFEVTVPADPGELAPVRHRIAAVLHAQHRTDAHIWRVSVVASELLTLSIAQGNDHSAILRLSALPDVTRVELVDHLQHLSVFDSPQGRLVTRVASIWGVMRDDAGYRTVWCDVTQ